MLVKNIPNGLFQSFIEFSVRLKTLIYVPGLIDSESRDLDSLLPPVLSESLNIPNFHDLMKEGPLKKE